MRNNHLPFIYIYIGVQSKPLGLTLAKMEGPKCLFIYESMYTWDRQNVVPKFIQVVVVTQFIAIHVYINVN